MPDHENRYDHQIFSMQEHGGISRYFVELADTLAGADCADISVIAPIHFNQQINNLEPDIMSGTHMLLSLGSAHWQEH